MTQTGGRFWVIGVVLVAFLLLGSQAPPNSSPSCTSSSTLPSSDFLIAGGQNGTWFRTGQDPRLFKIGFTNAEPTKLPTFQSQGTIWSGSTNGTEWLISGWGSDRYGANPPIMIYDSSFSIVYRSSAPNSSSSWYGGDIFASSYGRHEWLLSGMGSGYLNGVDGNHMALASLNGSGFTDLSSMVPNNQLGILYANKWNGSLWMVGGGYGFQGVLFTFNGTAVHDLLNQISQSVPNFGAVTGLAWNGTDWMIGGYQFLAVYDGHKFLDFTDELAGAVGQFHSVNAISWDEQDGLWLLGGGSAKADVDVSNAWIATFSSNGRVTNLSSLLSCSLRSARSSSILTSTFNNHLWGLGGYGGNGNQIYPILLVISLPAATVTDFSHAVGDMSYVIWVKLRSLNQHPPSLNSTCGLMSRSPDFRRCAGYEISSVVSANIIVMQWVRNHPIAIAAERTRTRG